MMSTIFKKLFHSNQFAPLLGAQFLGAFNGNFFKNALVLLVTYKIIQTASMRPEIAATIANTLFILPFFIFSALGGQLADKFEKASLIKILKFIEIPIALWAWYGFIQQNVLILFSTVFLIGIQFSLFGPVKYSFLPERLEKQELVAGNGLIDASTFIAILLGSVAGSLIVGGDGKWGTGIALILLLVAIAGWVISLFLPKGIPANASLKIDLNILRSTKKIIHDSIANNHEVFLAILGISWFWLIGFVLLAQFPAFTVQVLHASSGVVALFLALFTIGVASGSMLCNRLIKNELSNTYIPVSIFGMSFFLFDCAKTASHYALAHVHEAAFISFAHFLFSWQGLHISFDLFLFAVCGGIYIVPIYVLLQSIPPKGEVSRAIAGNNVINAVFMVLGTVFVWILLGLHFSLVTIFIILSILNTAVAIYICKLIPRALTKSFVKWILQALFKVQVTGLENIPQIDEPFLVVANHNSFIDAILIAAFFPKKLTFALSQESAKGFWAKALFNLIKLYPIDPTNPMTIKGLIHELKMGNNVMMFPEGRITSTGSLMKIYDAPGLIAEKAGAHILPIRIDGAQYSLFSCLKHRVRRRLLPKINLIIMPATKLKVDEKLQGRERRNAIADKLYDLMTYLMFASSDCQQTLFERLLEARRIHGRYKQVIVDMERKPITYQRLLTISFAFAQVLRRMTERNSCIGVMLPNSIAAIGLFCGCQAAARVPAMLNFTAGTANLQAALTAANIQVVFTARRLIEHAKLQEQVAVIEQQAKIIYLEDIKQEISILNKVMALLWAQIPTTVYNHLLKPANATDAAVVLFTSGSEGIPKGVALSHQNLLTNCAQLVAKVDVNSQDVFFNALPNFHSFGLTGGILVPLLYGIKSFYFPNPLQYRVIPELIYDTNTTIMFGTDTFLAGYAKCAHPYDFYAVRYVFAGAERVREETRRLWVEKFGVRILEGYGATEASPVISINTPMHNRSGTAGRLLPGINYKLEEIPGIHEGKQLLVKGANIALGYYTIDKPGVLQLFADEWYNTGDIVTIDADGFIKIAGRAKRFAKIGGEMVSLVAVEEIVAKYWPEKIHAAINMIDEKKGEKIVLITMEKSLTRDAVIKAFAAAGASELMIPREIITVDEIPLLGSGKVDYVRLKQLVHN